MTHDDAAPTSTADTVAPVDPAPAEGGHDLAAVDLGIDDPATTGRSPRATLAALLDPATLRSRLGVTARWALTVGAAVALYAVFLLVRGADPVAVFTAMFRSSLGSTNAIGETLVRAAPLLLAALATAVPARAGQFNIGGEGQLVIGAIGAFTVSQLLGGAAPAFVTLPLLLVGGMVAGALWGAIPGVLKAVTNTNEAITTILLNYLAALTLTYLVFVPWRDPASSGQAYSSAVTDRLPILWGNRVHVGIVVALVCAAVVHVILRRSTWGFQLRVVGGNPEAARRAGLRVGELQVTAIVVGGALAGLGGAIELAGIEARLRPDMMVGWGFIGFLASWMARHHALKAIVTATVLGAIAVGGSGLRLASGMSGSAVNILMAVLLLAILGWAPRRRASR